MSKARSSSSLLGFRVSGLTVTIYCNSLNKVGFTFEISISFFLFSSSWSYEAFKYSSSVISSGMSAVNSIFLLPPSFSVPLRKNVLQVSSALPVMSTTSGTVRYCNMSPKRSLPKSFTCLAIIWRKRPNTVLAFCSNLLISQAVCEPPPSCPCCKGSCELSLILFSTTPKVSKPERKSEPTLIARKSALGSDKVVTAPGTITSDAMISPPTLTIGLNILR